jgi:hypothetical protein
MKKQFSGTDRFNQGSHYRQGGRKKKGVDQPQGDNGLPQKKKSYNRHHGIRTHLQSFSEHGFLLLIIPELSAGL